MKTRREADGIYTLWGGSLSLYTGKLRSYLIKKNIPYRELYPSHPLFRTRIVPAVGLLVVPVLEAPDGTIIQDTTDIIEYLESVFPEPRLMPATPVQQATAWLLGAFGSEGLLQPAMHYRWSYREQQEDFLRAEFGRITHGGPDRTARFSAAHATMAAMNAYLPPLGIRPETIPAIEASYEALLDILDTHFLHHPYLLGGRPCIADFGLMAPLFAHLARDPVPSALMKTRAPNVFRWTERMNLSNIPDGEFPDCADAYPLDDAIPATLEPLLAHVFQDWGAELLAAAAHFNGWVADNPGLPSSHIASLSQDRRVHPGLGEISYQLHGCTITRSCAPQTLWHFDKAAGHARALRGDARAQFDALVRRTGGERVMAITLARALKRANYVVVLG
jgi:glutathione S-transferase